MTNDELPKGWIIQPLGEMTDIKTGKLDANAAKENGKYPFFTCAVGNLRVDSFSFDAEAVILAGNGTFGVKWYRGKFDAYQRTYVIQSEALSTRFLYYATCNFIAEITKNNRGSTIQYLRIGDITNTAIPVPPLAEQKRIADKLEAVLGRVDACRARLDRVPSLLKRFRQSVLAAATSGKLTEQWRASRKVTAWPERPLGSLCEPGRIITYGVIKLGDETPKGVPCLRTSNVRWLTIDTTGMKRIEKMLSNEYSRTILKGGEVLVNVRGTLGGVAVAGPEMAGWNVSREVAVVPLDQSILSSKFLAFWIGAESSQAWLTGVQKGVAYTGINIEDLRLLPIGIPTPTEQQEIVRRVEELFAFADRIEARLTTTQKTVERLTPSVLAKAFRGELVPQDPNDEPASVLLDRLRSQSTSHPAQAKRSKCR